MKKAIVTGLNGTLAPKLAEELRSRGWQVVAWDRHQVNPDSFDACAQFISDVKPDAICHLAMGAVNWCESLANLTAVNDIRLIFTSTAMVFNHEPNGPHYVNDNRTALDDYGKGKIACEDVILANNTDAVIARIGWQIDWAADGNNMYTHLQKVANQEGVIRASDVWYPATSLMSDTCSVLVDILKGKEQGVYQLDSNRDDRLSFAEIVKRINQKHQQNWQVETTQDYVHDQRLPDDRIKIPNISNHL